MKLPKVNTAGEVERLVDELGFLPLFRSSIPGFSLEEATPEDRWFKEGVEGPWEWREVLASSEKYAYGKIFGRKAGFVSLKWLPKFVNFRRDGYDFDARYEDSLAPEKAKRIVDVLMERGSMLSGDLKRAAGFAKDGAKGYDGMMALLQMQMYVTVERFDYKIDAEGRPYGFGTGRYALMERKFGEDIVSESYKESPAKSKQAILARVRELFPAVTPDEAERFIR